MNHGEGAHDDQDDESSGFVEYEDYLAAAAVREEEANVDLDLRAWSEFRRSASSETRLASRRSSSAAARVRPRPRPSFDEEEDEQCESDFHPPTSFVADDGGERSPFDSRQGGRGASEMRLTDDERLDNAIWRTRLEVDEVFGEQYVPKKWESREMNAIVGVMALKNPVEYAEYLIEPRQRVTNDAIRSIFFPRPDEPRSVLLKRGPVLVGGEERELSLFSGGFVLSRVEWNPLVDLLLDASSGKLRRSTSEALREKLLGAIDADGSHHLDCSEIPCIFRSMGVTLSDTDLERLKKLFYRDDDRTDALQEFISMTYELVTGKKPEEEQNGAGSFWEDMPDEAKRAFAKNGVTRSLDVAFRMSDVERAENLGLSRDEEPSTRVKPESAPLALAVFTTDTDVPLVVTCSKPGHVEAWTDAFRTCITWQLPTVDWGAGDIPRDGGGFAEEATSDDWRCSTIDWGVGDDDDEC